jgi:two-component system, OmpR family, phosphate regulon sensor histidine kinase PhoR
MFDTKNLSPKQLSALIALALSIPIGVILYIVAKNWWVAAIAFVAVSIGSYLLVSFALERFIYRKIKLIYKFIYQTKASKKEDMYYKYILPKKSIDEVRKDVEAWAEQSKNEIESLKKNEQFRKEFLQNLAHEFKTPVFTIQGYVESLLDGGMNNPETNTRFLRKTSKNVDRLSNLIKDLDEISKLEMGQQKLHKNKFIIQELIKEVFEQLSLHAEKKNIQCSIKKGCETPILVIADKEKIRQVIINLVDNSIKYGKENGSVIASMYRTDEKHALIEISDDGVGIPESNLGRIFERFYRTEKGRSIDITGSGLGLAICKHIIEAHEHNIHVRSTVGIGTSIGFTLDVNR